MDIAHCLRETAIEALSLPYAGVVDTVSPVVRPKPAGDPP
jgi:hypothetical protein